MLHLPVNALLQAGLLWVVSHCARDPNPLLHFQG